MLNVTPDSFSDGGRYARVDDALRRADEMVAEGVGVIDVGPESTRPGSDSVPADEQITRIKPVVFGIRRNHPRVPISIDTRIAEVACAAIDAGADIINDISALRDDGSMARLACETQTPVVLMHMRGSPKSMQADLGDDAYVDVVADVAAFLSERIAFAAEAGIPRDRIAIDPGIGFGKTAVHNLAILGHLDAFVRLGVPVLIGASRKRFLGTTTGSSDPRNRLSGSLACVAAAVLAGVQMVRVHDVCESVEVARVADAIRSAAAD